MNVPEVTIAAKNKKGGIDHVCGSYSFPADQDRQGC